MQDNYYPNRNIDPLTHVLENIFPRMKRETLQNLSLDLDDLDRACKIISRKINLIRKSSDLKREQCLQLINDVKTWIAFEIGECHMPRVKSFLKIASSDTPRKRGKMVRK